MNSLIKKKSDLKLKKFEKDGNPTQLATEMIPLEMDDTKKRRWGWKVLLIGFGGFLAWASFAPLDQGALLPGMVKVAGDTKTVQHPYGGVVEKILIKEGDKVEKGQLLVQLNPTKLKADLDVARTRWISVVSKEARLIAELGETTDITWPEWFEQNKDDRRVQDAERVQMALFKSRLKTRASEREALEQTVQALTASVGNLQQSISTQTQRLKYASEQLEGLKQMEQAGYLARNRLLEAQSGVSAISAALSSSQSDLARVRGQLAESKLKLAQLDSSRLSEIQNELSETQRLSEELNNQMIGITFDTQATEIRSPVTGFVTNLRVKTEGGVISPGTALMEVVPEGGKMQVLAQLATSLVGKVQPGMPVEVQFSSLNHRKTPKLMGEVLTVSADAIYPDQSGGMPYYLVQVKLDDNGTGKVGPYTLTPGMPAEAFVQTGERTMMNYLFKPLTDRFNNALHEE